MKRQYFEDLADIAEFMVSAAGEGHCVDAVLLSEETAQLAKELLCYEDVKLGSIEYDDITFEPDCEYYITITDDNVLFIERAKQDNGDYLYSDADIILLSGDVSSSILRTVSEENCIEISFEPVEEDEDCNDRLCGECSKDCTSCKFIDDDERWDALFEDSSLIYGKDDKVIGISLDANKLFKFLFR